MTSTDSDRTASHLTDRITDLEQRVAALEDASAPASDTPPPLVPGTSLPDIVAAVKNSPDLTDGAVMFGGSVTSGSRTFDYQWVRPTHWVADNEWDDQIERLAALAHPIRGEILRRLLCAPGTAAELVSEGVVSSAGTAYHHLNALQSAGWVAKTSGSYSVPASRVIPLMTIITAAEAH
ncbi:winged helix-turn-helix domain-containing protein [Corynebacterium timonense]|uniref:Helix-turn-helix domain-containing protein n=1 Tax=Corynebacterium timonense TaxID=441500 RepID=A0A1H1Q0P8_9CORY|nr:winged helix-turn-helix domain-containing protein [Corynebacterium timonense]SDS16995.1 Helix-turn-helix domain-containing protein [Corynebacterium timonense]